MQLKGCGYRWVVRQRRKSQDRKEQKQKAMQEFQELKQKVFEEILPEELKKEAMVQAKAQANNEVMKFEQKPQDSFAYEITHNPESHDPGAIANPNPNHEVSHNLESHELEAIAIPKLRES